MSELDQELRLKHAEEELAIGFYEWLEEKGYFKENDLDE
jgi:hypothetical protein